MKGPSAKDRTGLRNQRGSTPWPSNIQHEFWLARCVTASPHSSNQLAERKKRRSPDRVVWKTKVEEDAKIDEVDGRYREEDRPLPSAVALLAPPYCRNYNVIDSIVIIDCSSSCPSRRVHRGSTGVSTAHEPEMARIYGFTERIRAMLLSSRAYSSSSSISHICVTSPSWSYNVALLFPWVAGR